MTSDGIYYVMNLRRTTYIRVHDRISMFVSLENNDSMKYEVSAIYLYVFAKFAKV